MTHSASFSSHSFSSHSTSSSKPVFSFAHLPPLILKRIFDYVGTTYEGLQSLALTERSVLYASIYGIEAVHLISKDDKPALLLPLKLSGLARHIAAQNKASYKQNILSLKQPSLSFRLEIARSFIDKMEMYCEDNFNIKPKDFHDIMGREHILKRPGNIPNQDSIKPRENVAFNLDYAYHIALAFNLVKFKQGHTQLNCAALLKVVLKLSDQSSIKCRFMSQKATVDAIRNFSKTERTELDLSHPDNYPKKIYALPPHIGELANLTLLSFELNLSNNYLTTLPPEIWQLQNLTDLYLYYNQFTSLPREIGHLSRLCELDLDNNSLTTLPPEIGKLTKLTDLHLGWNQLETLPPELRQLEQLDYLGIDDNPFVRDSAFEDLLSQLRNKDIECAIID